MNNNEILKIIKEMESNISILLLQDQVRLRSRLNKIKLRLNNNQPVDRIVEKLQLSYEYAVELKNKRDLVRFTISYPSDLPICSKIEEIKNLIINNQVVIVCGTTGSGKTTQLPKILLEAGCGRSGRIGCTQPRRLAASGMARRVANETFTAYGKSVGCKVRFADDTSNETVIKFMTDGILLAETMSDKLLFQYDAIIIDEAHERSLNIDFTLGYIKNLLHKRPDLKVVISSATLDAESFSCFFDNAPVIQIEGRTYPVEDFFLPPEDEEEELSSHVLRAVEWVTELDKKGDILIFLPGEREIREAADLLNGKKWKETEILPLFGRLSMAEQQQVFKTGGRRRVILSTNVAETSITIPGIHYVIDSGLVRLSRYNPRTHIQALQIEQVSRASAKQRRGRCGRIAEGVCVYLYSRDTLEEAPDYTDPEICRTSLAGVILQMEMLGLSSIDTFPFIDPPQYALIKEGYNALFEIGALNKNNVLTEEGKTIASFPVDPHLAKMLCYAEIENIIPEILVVVSFLSIQDPKERPTLKHEAADKAHSQWFDERSDYISILKLWNFFQSKRVEESSNTQIRKLCKQNFINYRRLREWFSLYQDLFDVVDSLDWKYRGRKNDVRIFDDVIARPINKADGFGKVYSSFHKCILSGLPRNIGIKGEDAERAFVSSSAEKNRLVARAAYIEPNIYIGTKRRKFNIFPGSNLFKDSPRWIMTFALVETSKLYARLNAAIEPEWLEEIIPGLCKYSYSDIHWDKNRGFVAAKETVSFAGLVIKSGRKVHYGKIFPVKARQIFIRDAMVPGEINTWDKWLKFHRRMLYNIEQLETKIRRPESLLNKEAVFEYFDKVLPDTVFSKPSLEQWIKKTKTRIAMSIEDAMIPQLEPIDLKDYPDKLTFYNTPFKLKYFFEPGEIKDGLILYCPSDQINLLPDWALDWMVPGWLSEKVNFLIKSLPKRLRIICNPVQQTADEFVSLVKRENISMEQHLLEALMNFLLQKFDLKLSVEEFDLEKIPEYMIMKVAEIDKDGKVLKITKGLPEREYVSTKLSSSVLAMKKWIKTGLYDWPDKDVLPETISLQDANSTLDGYPALVDEEKSVGIQIFTDKREAEKRHKYGLIRLFRLQYAGQERYLEKKLPINNKTLLTLGLYYNNSDYKKDFVDNAIYLSLTQNNTVKIRGAETFNFRAEEALGDLYGVAEKMGRTLDLVINEKSEAESIMNTVYDADDSVTDIEHQLSFLFREGFMKNEIVWGRYLRYVKAIRIRAERLKYSAAKDYLKMQEIIPFQNMLDERLKKLKDIDCAYGLMEFAWYLQDFRIALFAPELKPFEKVSVKRLEKAWDNTLRDRLAMQ